MPTTRWLMLVTLLALPRGAEAVERRVALLVGHPLGGERLQPLRYVQNDLERMRDVLTLLGGFAESDVIVSYREDVTTVTTRFEQARRVVQSAVQGLRRRHLLE
ncbi:MAG: hypothetical protein AAB426_15275, partial [Myxococcota bacterium]